MPKKMTTSAATANTRVYKKNFLTMVLARIDFASPQHELRKGATPKLLKALNKRFPIAEEKMEAQKVNLGPIVLTHHSSQEFKWYYYSKDKQQSVHVAEDTLWLNYSKYNQFDEFRDDFLKVTSALFGEHDDLQVKRFGLRYIDNITFPKEKVPTDWSKYLSPKLLGGFSLADDPKTIARSMAVLEFNYGDEMRMRFQYGMPNEDYPSPIKKKMFVLDYDAYIEQLIGQQEIQKCLDLFHMKIKSSFEEVITDGLRKVMG